jgi:hypothetical protein
MAKAMTLIQSQVLSATQTSFTFSSIPGSFRDIRIIVTSSTAGEGNLGFQANGDGASNYTQVNMRGFSTSSIASSAGSSTQISTNFSTGMPSGERGLNIYDVLEYSQTDRHKTILVRGNHQAEVDAIAGRWASTAAITSVTITSGATFNVGSTFYLYGIAG